jgi:hypothetical protein
VKITKLGRPLPLISGGSLFDGDSTPGSPFTPGPPGHVLTSTGSNSAAWSSNVALITSNGSNLVQGPFVNFASGTGTAFSVSSNTLTISNTGPVGDFLTADDGAGDILSTVAASGAAETIDLADGNVHDVTLTDDCTFTFTGAGRGGRGPSPSSYAKGPARRTSSPGRGRSSGRPVPRRRCRPT